MLKKNLVEHFLSDKMIDYKIYCLNGKPEFILVKNKLNNEKDTIINNYYNANWKLTGLET